MGNVVGQVEGKQWGGNSSAGSTLLMLQGQAGTMLHAQGCNRGKACWQGAEVSSAAKRVEKQWGMQRQWEGTATATATPCAHLCACKVKSSPPPHVKWRGGGNLHLMIK